MKATFKKTVLGVAVAAAMGVSATASAQVVDFSYSGMFTMLSAAGAMMANTSAPHASNEWSGLRTNITGTMHFDTVTGAGSGTVVDFDFFDGTAPAQAQGIVFQAIGNGAGGPGTLVLGNMLFNWNGNNGIPVSLVMDAQGMFASMGTGFTVGQVIDGTYGTLGASDGLKKGAYAMGNMAVSTTGWNTATCAGAGLGSAVSGCFPLTNNTIGGDPMIVVLSRAPMPTLMWLR